MTIDDTTLRLACLEAQLADAMAEKGQLGAKLHVVGGERDGAYHERNQLVALLAALFPASLEHHAVRDGEEPPWDLDWLWVVIIDLPTGQASWHIHVNELPLFGHLPRLAGRKWDGHTTAQKYERVAALCRRIKS